MKKKIEAMHQVHGIAAGCKCENCPNLVSRGYGRRTYRKCKAYGTSASEATDWAKSWTACGLFGKPFPMERTPLLEIIKYSKNNAAPIDGQITIFEVM